MIELVVKYIRDKGFIVDVRPGVLVIRKYAQDELCSIGWAISPYDLRPEFEEVLYYQATKRCEQIDQAIAVRGQGGSLEYSRS